MSLVTKPRYQFADAEIDPLRGCLRRKGEEVYLRPQTFRVLLYLIEHREQVVTKDELIEKVWKGTAVTDESVAQCIKEIRRALEDDARKPRFVKTIPKIGYRFISPVEENGFERQVLMTEEITSISVEVEEETNQEAEPVRINGNGLSAPKRFLSRKFLLSAALLIATVTALALGIYFQRQSRRPQLAETSLTPAPGKKTVAVMYFENQSGSRDLDWLRAGLADMFIRDLARSQSLQVLSRQQLHALLERSGINASENITLDEALEIAARSHAEVVVIGSFAKLGEKIQINVQLHDGHTGQLLTTEGLTADRPDQVFAQVDLLSLKLAPHLGAAPNSQDSHTGLADVMTDNLDAYRYYSLGVEQAQALHSTEAVALFEKAIQLDPKFAMAYARIGYVYVVADGLMEKGKPYLEKAFQLAERLTEKDRLNIAAWYAIANLDYAGAIDAFQQIIAQYPTDLEAYVRLGNLLRFEERNDEAIEVLKRGLTVDTDAKDIYNVLGMCYMDLGRHDEAIAAHRRYVALAPNEPNAHDSLGMSYQWAGMYEQAIEAYDRALALNPEFEIAVHHLGNVYLQQGQYRKALSQFERFLRVAPSDWVRAEAYHEIFYIYQGEGDRRRAEEAANNELRYGRDYSTYIWDSLVLAVLAGDQYKADKLKQQLQSLPPRPGRGTRDSLRALYFRRGWLDLKGGRAESAIENFKEAIRHTPMVWMPDLMEDCLANAYLELGRFDEAIIEYERIRQLNPNYPLLHFHLAQAYEGRGDFESSRKEYGQFLQVWSTADREIPEVRAARAKLNLQQ